MGYYRLRKTSEGQFADVSDDGNIGVIGSNLYAFNGTNNVTVNNNAYKSSDGGRTWTQLPNAPWSIRNASGMASVGGKLYLWGGNDYSGALQDSWLIEEDGAGGLTYTQISAAMSGHNRQSFSFGYADGYFYSIGGMSQTTVLKSADLITWTTVSTLPANLQGMATSACVWGGVWYIVTSRIDGVYPGEPYKSTDNLQTFSLVLQDSLFAQQWNNIEATADALLLVRGHNQDAGGNQKGCWYCEGDPAQLTNWKRLPYELPASHATPLCSDGSKIYSYSGNMRNDSWEFARTDV